MNNCTKLDVGQIIRMQFRKRQIEMRPLLSDAPPQENGHTFFIVDEFFQRVHRNNRLRVHTNGSRDRDVVDSSPSVQLFLYVCALVPTVVLFHLCAQSFILGVVELQIFLVFSVVERVDEVYHGYSTQRTLLVIFLQTWMVGKNFT